VARHFVKVVDDDTLPTDDGWIIARCEDTGDLVFVVERAKAADEEVLWNAWSAAANFVIEAAVREGIVRHHGSGMTSPLK